MDEDGVDVVEAINAWIDEQIDDLSDEELARTREVLDVVAASPLADVDAADIDPVDIDELVDLVGGSAASRTHADQLLRAALSDEPVAFPRPFIADQLDPQALTPTGGTLFSASDDDDDDGTLFSASDDDHDDDDGESGEPSSESDRDLFDPTDGFWKDLGRAERTDEVAAISGTAIGGMAIGDLDDRAGSAGSAGSATAFSRSVGSTRQSVPSWASNVGPVPLRENDMLGPSFLPEPAGGAPGRRGRLRHLLVPLFLVVGLIAFGFGMLQLIDSLGDESTAAATTEPTDALAAADPEPTATAEPSVVPTPTAEATPVPTPPPHPGFAIRLESGDVMVADYEMPGEPPTLTKVYDVTRLDQSPAREIEWGTIGLAVVDDAGDVLLLDPDAPQDLRLVFEATDEFGEAVELALVGDSVAIRTSLGNIALATSTASADPNDVELVWNAADQGAAVIDISSVDAVVPFVLDNGDARMIDTESGNAVTAIWSAEGQAPAFNIEGSPAGILMGIGQGAVARYRLGDNEGGLLEPVWDPFGTAEAPAIGYSGVGDDTAIVLADGTIVLADETGTGPRLWEPATTEIRAFIAAGSETQIIVLLETGSVVRIPVDSEEPIESVWDVTDETLSPANQIVLEPSD